MNATTIRPIAAHQVKTHSLWAGWHAWTIYVGPRSEGNILRAQAQRDEETGEWVVSTKDDLAAEPVEVARVKTLKSVREVFAWIYNDMAGAEQPGLSEILESASKTARRKAAPAVSPAEAGIKVGDHFVSLWGYDQSNVDYFEVVGLTPKGVKVQRVASRVVEEYMGGEKVVPSPGAVYGEVETKILKGSEAHPYFALTSYSSGSKWNGTPNHRTAAGWGH